MKRIFALIFLLTIQVSRAQANGAIHCTLIPRSFTNNLYLDLDSANQSFAFSQLDRSGQPQPIPNAQGKIKLEGHDSQGFDRFSLCWDPVCSGETYAGSLKQINPHDGQWNDRRSYLEMNPNSKTKINYVMFNQTEELGALSAFECSAL